MKKKVAMLMALVCLVFCFESISAFAVQYGECPNCNGTTIQYGEHLGDWKTVYNWTDKYGNSYSCNETHSMDRAVWYCTKEGKTVEWGDPDLTIAHSRTDCPNR